MVRIVSALFSAFFMAQPLCAMELSMAMRSGPSFRAMQEQATQQAAAKAEACCSKAMPLIVSGASLAFAVGSCIEPTPVEVLGDSSGKTTAWISLGVNATGFALTCAAMFKPKRFTKFLTCKAAIVADVALATTSLLLAGAYSVSEGAQAWTKDFIELSKGSGGALIVNALQTAVSLYGARENFKRIETIEQINAEFALEEQNDLEKQSQGDYRLFTGDCCEEIRTVAAKGSIQ